MNEIELKEREKRKMIAHLKRMQYMWIESHRLHDQEIDHYDLKELTDQIKLHQELWKEYDTKPKVPTICLTCGKQTSAHENHLLNDDDELEWYNDECRECLV